MLRPWSLLGFLQASLNGSSELWAVETVPSCLIPGPGMSKEEEYSLLGSVTREEGRFGYPMVSLHSKYVLLPEFLAVFSTSNCQPQRGGLSSARNTF